VIENEFGEIDIDSELVARTETLEGSTDSITMLSNGCLCCTVRCVVLFLVCLLHSGVAGLARLSSWHACYTVKRVVLSFWHAFGVATVVVTFGC
jgi:hypothetical protein